LIFKAYNYRILHITLHHTKQKNKQKRNKMLIQELADFEDVSVKTIKIILVGEGKTGKTNFMRKTMGYDELPEYQATLGVEVHPYIYYAQVPPTSSDDVIKFNVWDCSGNAQFKGLGELYWLDAQYAIVFSESYVKAVVDKGIPYKMFDSNLSFAQHVDLSVIPISAS
jgi:GTPase SAR1 family protein